MKTSWREFSQGWRIILGDVGDLPLVGIEICVGMYEVTFEWHYNKKSLREYEGHINSLRICNYWAKYCNYLCIFIMFNSYVVLSLNIEDVCSFFHTDEYCIIHSKFLPSLSIFKCKYKFC